VNLRTHAEKLSQSQEKLNRLATQLEYPLTGEDWMQLVDHQREVLEASMACIQRLLEILELVTAQRDEWHDVALATNSQSDKLLGLANQWQRAYYTRQPKPSLN